MKRLLALLLVLLISGTGLAQRADQATAPTPLAESKTVRPELILITHDVDYRRADAERLVAGMRIFATPETQIAWVSPAVGAVKAVDEKGNSYAYDGPIPKDLANANIPINHVAPQGDERQFWVVFKMPPANVEIGHQLQSVDGVLAGGLITKTKRISLAANGRATDTLDGGVKVTVVSQMQVPTLGRVTVTFDLPRDMSEADRRKWVNQSAGCRLWFEGTGWTATGNMGSGGSGTQFERDLYFSGSQQSALPEVNVEVVVDSQPAMIPFHCQMMPLP